MLYCTTSSGGTKNSMSIFGEKETHFIEDLK